MGRYIVGYEGRDTADGRLIEVGALSARSPRIPIVLEFNYADPRAMMGWAEEFGRRLNEETGFTEISFELYFRGDWEQKVKDQKLTPTCAMAAVTAIKPYDKPEEASAGKNVITGAQVTAVGFSIGPNAWGEYPK